jgi:hypothetical protein
VDLQSLATEAQHLSRDDFVDRFSGHYLVFTEKPESLGGGFRTVVAPTGFSKKKSAAQPTDVLAIRKAPGNPYPDRISIGRARNCDLTLRHESVSKLHAHFACLPDGSVELRDDRSQNGTTVNDRPLSTGGERLRDGDVLRFGVVVAVFVDANGLFDVLQDV